MAIFSARFNFEITMIIYKWNKAELIRKEMFIQWSFKALYTFNYILVYIIYSS